MCGIVGAISKRNVATLLLNGLKRLEYRGYDSAGLALIDEQGGLRRIRREGKVKALREALDAQPLDGHIGIAHTRWATHGIPCERNAHPQASRDELSIVHNGIIENHEVLRRRLSELGYQFESDTDTEVIAHLLHHQMGQANDCMHAIRLVSKELRGSFGVAILHRDFPDRLMVMCQGSPLVLGFGVEESFVASDQLALLHLAESFLYLEEGDTAEVHAAEALIWDKQGQRVDRPRRESMVSHEMADKGQHRHFMQKEMFEQPQALKACFDGRLSKNELIIEALGANAQKILSTVQHVQIVACGTSYHAGMVARDWLATIAGVACNVDIASEYRYRPAVVLPGTLFISISQSGETADTLAALKMAKELPYMSYLAVCNVPESAIVRHSDWVLLTHAGIEIGVASTKAFTTQLAVLLMLALGLGRTRSLSKEQEKKIVHDCHQLLHWVKDTLALDTAIRTLAGQFIDKNHTLFLGRGWFYPIALEGALKLKELSYIHAEAYPAGELKHGPLALVDKDMPVVALVANDCLNEKTQSNLQEVQARGGKLFLFADSEVDIHLDNPCIVALPPIKSTVLAPILYSIPMQLLAYHVAVLKGTDVDQPRNLAKSVTVE